MCNQHVEGDKCDVCKTGYGVFPDCDQCIDGYHGYPNCIGKCVAKSRSLLFFQSKVEISFSLMHADFCLS